MAFRKKAEFILTEQPNIQIVPECENQERLSFGLYTKQSTDIFSISISNMVYYYWFIVIFTIHHFRTQTL